MNPLLVALLGALLIPLFVATWRTSLLGLGAQGLLMALVALHLAPPAPEATDWLTFADLALVRGLLAPAALYVVLKRRNAAARHDVIPPNLLSWTVALGMVLVAFSVAELLVPDPGEPRTLVAVSAAALLLGFLVLSTQSSPFGQMMGALQLENAIALLELGGPGHSSPFGLQLAMLAIFVATVAFFRWYLDALHDDAQPAAPAEAEGPTL